MNNNSISPKSETDWQRLDTMSDEEIDFSDCPEVTPAMFAKAKIRRPPHQTQVTLTLDSDVLAWYEAQGESAQRQMAIALKIYAEAHQERSLL